ncbi:TraM recognition domain-containing protein [Paenibacillus sp. LS1]|uniref:type IV secretory system conjugative DNA transfer family protein n=1 Tax=Paenibacillus sp. LS1 TaxID=2992120 RepID=UPI00223220D3|nr:TraM recognition domain-containing protein [Paenibacillus sp. LS1]MCW3794003.1 TraM recognition domain-containing protein [Paenibacillus sp. LS1]
MANAAEDEIPATKEMPIMEAYSRKLWVNVREKIFEYYRSYFHTFLVSILMVVNVVTAYSAFIIYLSQWKHDSGNFMSVLDIFFQEPPMFLAQVLIFPFIQLDENMRLWCIFFLNLPVFTWLYSSVVQPIKRGHKKYLDWRGKRGRIVSAALNGSALAIHYCAIFAWYVEHYLFDFFSQIKSDQDYLIVHSMTSFGYILMAIPVLICLNGLYLIMKEFHMNEDLRTMFFSWEFGLLARHAFSLKSDSSDVIVGWEEKTNKPIVLSEKSRFLHELIIGATGTGKTSTTILTRIVQDLVRIARGKRLGICVLEPKGDLIDDVLVLCKKLGIPKSKIRIIDPTKADRSIKFNPFVGPMDTAAATFRGVLDALAGDQDDFFKGQQSETSALYTMLGKIRHGNSFSILHMQKMYGDARYLADMTEEVRTWLKKTYENPVLTEEDRLQLDRYERICSYFENDILDYKTYRDKEQKTQPVLFPDGHQYEGKQVVENKKDKFVAGAKKYINDICTNALLSSLMVAEEGDEVLDIDQFLAEGGVLLVNTALGELEELSLSFGQFFIRQFQSSVFRRPKENRFPIFFDIDEFPLFINEAFQRFLTVGRSYMVGTLIAIQSLGQLESVVRGYDKIIMSNASNKTVFGRGEVSDNEWLSKQFGEEPVVEESMNESLSPASQPNPSTGYRYNTSRKEMPRFTPTQIMEQKFKGFIVQIVGQNEAFERPVQAYGKFINETKFIKRFVKIGQAELQTVTHKPIQNPLQWVKNLVISMEEKKDALEAITREKTEENAVQTAPEEGNPIEENAATAGEEVPNNSEAFLSQRPGLPVRNDYGEENQEPTISVDSPEIMITWPEMHEPAHASQQEESDFFFYADPNPEANPEPENASGNTEVYSEPNAEVKAEVQNFIRKVGNEKSEPPARSDDNSQGLQAASQKTLTILDLIASDATPSKTEILESSHDDSMPETESFSDVQPNFDDGIQKRVPVMIAEDDL